MGKTALLEDAITAADGFRVMRVAGVESEMALGFAALHRLLLPVRDRVRALPRAQQVALDATYGLGDGRVRDRFLVGLAVLTLITDLATDQPVLCVIDDAQWVDRESLQLLSFVGRRLDADHVVLLFAFRDDGDVAVPEGLPSLRIGALPPERARELLETHSIAPVARDVASTIVGSTGGSPLAIMELAHALTATQLAGHDALPDVLPVGAHLEQHFRTQVQALPYDVQLVLLLAAADPTGDTKLVWTAARDLGIPLAAESAVEQSDLVSLDRSVQFRHPLIRAAAYSAATTADRRRAHGALAGAIDRFLHPDWHAWHRAAAATGPDEDVAAELARCADVARSRGGYAAEATFRTRAAELTPDALRRGRRLLNAVQAHVTAGAPVTAARLLNSADALAHDPESHAEVLRLRAALHVLDRAGTIAAPLVTAARMLEPIDAQAARDLFADAIAAVLVSWQLTTETTPVEVARAALAAPRPARADRDVVGQLLDGFATRIAVGYREAYPILHDALDALQRSSASLTGLERWALLLNYLGIELWREDTTYSLLRRVEQLDRDTGALETLRIRLEGLGHHEMWRGRFGEAERCHAECVDVSVSLGGDPESWALNSVELRAWQGDDAATRAMAQLLLSPALETIGVGVIASVARMALVVLDIAQGRYREAFDHAWYVFQIDPVSQGNQTLPEVIESGVRCGELNAARAARERLADRATVAGTPWALGLLARSNALLARDDEPDDLYREALDLLARTEIVIDLARTHLLYGEWLRRRQRRVEAREHLRQAFEMFSTMGARAFEERARVELASIGERAPRHELEPGGDLTPQEAQIARLASAGATDAAIAARLFVSAATVDHRLRDILRKLGLTSRDQLTDELLP